MSNYEKLKTKNDILKEENSSLSRSMNAAAMEIARLYRQNEQLKQDRYIPYAVGILSLIIGVAVGGIIWGV